AQVFGCERGHQHTAACHMHWLVLVYQRTTHVVVVLLKDLGHFRYRRRDWLKHVGRTEGDRVAKDVFDGRMACNDPIVQFGTIKDRQLLACPAYVFRGIDHVVILERVECMRFREQFGLLGSGSGTHCSMKWAAGSCRWNRAHDDLVIWFEEAV